MAASLVRGFAGRRVLTLESRRAAEMRTLIATFGGEPVSAPALQDVPLESNSGALSFAALLQDGGLDMTIFLTGVGTRTLIGALEPVEFRQAICTALAQTRVVARGPKPLAVLRALGVPVWAVAPEPNTWREVISAIETGSDPLFMKRGSDPVNAGRHRLAGARIAVQEYGVESRALLDALRGRGAEVTPIRVYRWSLPEDVRPLEDAAVAIARRQIDVLLLTTGVQLVHFWQVVRRMGLEAEVNRGLDNVAIASIGPSTSEELRRHGLMPDIEPSHPKIGYLVRETAERHEAVLAAKRRA